MSPAVPRRMRCATALALAGLCFATGAQSPPADLPRAPTAKVQAMFEQQASFAGVDLRSGCYILGAGAMRSRTNFLSCPGGDIGPVTGTLRFKGDLQCSTFMFSSAAPMPLEVCREWFVAGPDTYEVREDGRPALLLHGLPPPGAADAAAPAPQLSGQQLRQLLERRFAYAGRHHPSGCYFLNSASGEGRAESLYCNGKTLKVAGRMRVEGDHLCGEFPAPVGSKCLAMQLAPDGRFVQLQDGAPLTSGFVLRER